MVWLAPARYATGDSEAPFGAVHQATMAIREMTLKAWAKAVESADPHRAQNLQGDSPGGVAARLGCTRQNVHKLIKNGTLDAIAVYEGDRLSFYVVTEASLRLHQQRTAADLAKRLAMLTTELTPR